MRASPARPPATTGMVQVMGEISTSCYVDIPKIARDTVREIGYDRAKYGFDCDTCAVLTAIDEQSADIALGVDNSLESKEGASEADLDDRRRRSGHDVRLCLRRDARAYAAADLSGAQAGKAPDRGAQERHARLSPSGRQEPGHGRVRRRTTARARGHRGHLHPAQPGGIARADPRGYDRTGHQARHSRPSCSTRTPSILSTPPAALSSAARRATPA